MKRDMLTRLLIFTILSVSAQALAFNAPRATPLSPVLAHLAQAPLPTSGPSHADLLKRQAEGDSNTWLTALFGTSSLCGYVSGASPGAYACGTAFTCNFLVGSVTETSTSYGEVACCNDDFCGVRTTCIDYVDYWTSSLCDDDCATNMQTAKCTGIETPYCNGIRFVDEWSEDWFCDSISVSTWQLAYTTTAGEVNDRGFILTSWDPSGSDTTSSFRIIDTASASGSNVGAAPVTFTVTTEILPPSATLPPVTTTSTSSSITLASTSGPASKNTTPVGAIVGGVVGGVVGIALVALVCWFCLRKRNKARPDIQTVAYSDTLQQQPQHIAPDSMAAQTQMSQNQVTPNGAPNGAPNGQMAGYFKPNLVGTVHEVDSNQTSPGGDSSHRVSNATELDSHAGSPTPSHAVSAMTSSNYTQQSPLHSHYVSPSDEIHEMSATSGPWSHGP